MHGEERRRTWETPLIPALSEIDRKAQGRLGTEGETRTQRERLAPKREDRERTGRRPELRRQGKPKILGESDQLIVLRERESRLHGEGADSNP
jgi:hypothetical protein